jgi:hypothetical protein
VTSHTALQEFNSSDESEAGSLGNNNLHVLEKLCQAQSSGDSEPRPAICNAPPPALALQSRSQGLAQSCEQVAGRAFQQLRVHYHEQYRCLGVDMAAVCENLTRVAAVVPAAKRKAACSKVSSLHFKKCDSIVVELHLSLPDGFGLIVKPLYMS